MAKFNSRLNEDWHISYEGMSMETIRECQRCSRLIGQCCMMITAWLSVNVKDFMTQKVLSSLSEVSCDSAIKLTEMIA